MSSRQADFSAAVAQMQTVIANCETDIGNADSDSFEIGRLRDRMQSALQELGFGWTTQTTGSIEPGQ